MNDKQRAQWAQTRSKGRLRYILRWALFGLLLLGVFSILAPLAFQEPIKTREVILRSVTGLLIGTSSGYFRWKDYEQDYNSDQTSNEI